MSALHKVSKSELAPIFLSQTEYLDCWFELQDLWCHVPEDMDMETLILVIFLILEVVKKDGPSHAHLSVYLYDHCNLSTHQADTWNTNVSAMTLSY